MTPRELLDVGAAQRAPRARAPSVFDDRDHYPGIVLHQPYAGLIRLAGLGYAGKTIETRPRRITYRGPLIIIAGQKTDEEAARAARERLVMGHDVPHAIVAACFGLRGVAVARFEVADCRPLLPNDEQEAFFYAPGRWAWLSSKVEAIEPFAVQGHQGFMRVPRGAVKVIP